MSEVKKILKSACGREEVKQLGNVSIGFGCHAVGQKVIAVNLRYFSAYNTGILSYKTDKWFPLSDIQNSKVAVMIGYYIYFENILVFILSCF